MQKINWEVVLNTTLVAFGDLWRCKVPGGWMIADRSSATSTDKELVFVPDATFAWALPSLTWESVSDNPVGTVGSTLRAKITGGWLVGNYLGDPTSGRTLNYLVDVTGNWLADTGPSINPVTDLSLTQGTAFTFTPVISSPIAYTVALVGSLPAGLSIDVVTGTISGTSTVFGTFTGFKFEVLSSVKPAESNVFSFNIAAAALPTPVFQPIAAQAVVMNEAFKLSPTLNNAIGHSVVYSVVGTLPAGLVVDAATGVVSGIPTQAGSFDLVLRATYAEGQSVSNSFNLMVSSLSLSMGSVSLIQSQSLSLTPTVSIIGTIVPTYSIVGTLPVGLSINATTGVISGVPTTAGATAGLKLRATFSSSTVDSASFSIVVEALPVVSTIADANLTVGTAFTLAVKVSNPDALVLSFSSTGTALPVGLTLDTTTGVITGTPTTASALTGCVVRVSFNGLHVDSNAFSMTIAGVVVVPPLKKSNLGVNLSECVDYGTDFAFKDLIRMGRNWSFISASTSQPFGAVPTLDAQGYPLALVSGQVARMYFATTLPAGTYVLTHDGKGTVSFNHGASISWVDISATDTTDHIRNLHLFIPGTSDPDGSSPFYQPFLDGLAGVGVIRFMDWNSTNLTKIVNWADRTTVDHYSYVGGTSAISNVHKQQNTVPYEHQITLCNKVGADMWLNVPSTASDDYITQLAKLVHTNLRSDLKCYWELGNEIWNGAFVGNGVLAALGASLGYGSDFSAILKAQSHRSVQMFALVDAVYGVDATTRRKRVIAGQIVSYGTGSIPDTLLSWENAYQHVDFYAGAPYITVKVAAGASADTIYKQVFVKGDGYDSYATVVANNLTFLKKYNIPLAFYELGTGFPNAAGDSSAAGYALLATQARMEGVMDAILQNVWFGPGAGPACYFNFCAPSTSQGFDWGLIRSITATDTPKMRAFRTFLAK